MHSSYRSTFRTLGDVPLAKIERDVLTPIKTDWRPRREDRKVRLETRFEERVAILYYYPNMHPDVLEAFIEGGYKGIVIAGTGWDTSTSPFTPPWRRPGTRESRCS